MINPRTLAGRDQDPCGSLLTTQQLAGFRVRSESARSEALPSRTTNCSWGRSSEGKIISVAPYAHRDVLVDAYRNRAFPIFVPTTISAFPAVIQQSAPSSITCTVTTGVADGEGVDVSVGLFEGDDAARRSCDEAVAVSAALISNLPTAS